MMDILLNIFNPKFLLVWFGISFIYIKVSEWFNPDGDSWLLSNITLGGRINSMKDQDITNLKYGAENDNVWFFAWGLIGVASKIFVIGIFVYMIMYG